MTVRWEKAVTPSSQNGFVSNLKIEVNEAAADNYATSITKNSETSEGALTVSDEARSVSWTNPSAGGTVVFKNQRETYDITVAKVLESNTSAATSFNYTASYTDSYTSGGSTVTTTTDLDDFSVVSGSSYVLEDVPAGTTLSIVEAEDADDNYLVTAVSTAGASDSDSTGCGFTFDVTQDDTITYNNTLRSYPVTFRLVDQDGNITISAMFALSSSIGSLGTDLYANAASTTKPGIFYTSDKLWADTYTLSQTTVPTGYIGLSDDVTLTVTGNGIESNNEFVTVTGNAVDGYVVTVKNWAQKEIDVTKVLTDAMLTSTRAFGSSYSYTSPVSGETVEGTFTLSPTSNGAGGATRTLRIPINATDLVITELTSGTYATVPDIYTTACAGVGADGTTTLEDGDTESDYVFKIDTVTEDATITYENERKTSDVTVKKVVGDGDTTTEFPFTATLLNGGTPIAGYTVYTDESDSSNNLTTDASGQVSFGLKHDGDQVLTIPSGAKLVVTETDAHSYTPSFAMVNSAGNVVSDGDTAADSFTASNVTLDGTLTVTNSAGVPVRIIKTDQTGAALEGAVFALAGEGIADQTVTSAIPSGGTEAVIYTNDSMTSGTYTLTETDVPDGYIMLEGVVTLTIGADSTTGQIIVTPTIGGASSAFAQSAPADVDDPSKGWVVTIMNSTGYELPASGGFGTGAIYAVGVGLVAAAGVILVAKQRRKRAESAGRCRS